MQKVRGKIVLGLAAILLLFGCQPENIEKVETNSAQPTVQPTKNEIEKPKAQLPIDISKLVNKTIDELDKTLGQPEAAKPTEDGGDYRLYQVAGHPKGLAVRFYGGKAKSFNLIVNQPFPSSKVALKQAFGIEVGNISPVKDPKEPLSEKYQGTFNGVKFSKVSAKKQETGNGFIFVLAEVAK